jgi:NADPH:quinone reductase
VASGVYQTFFASFVFGKPGSPLSDVPLQEIAADVEAGRYSEKPSRVFRFEDIQEAHRVVESNEAKVNIVVML